jgi:hypothetical protein
MLPKKEMEINHMASDLTGVEMKEQKEPKFISFGKDGVREGSTIEGVFLRIDSVTNRESKKMPRLVFAEGEIQEGRFDPTGDQFAFLATYDLAQKLRMDHVGHFVQIRYEGEDHAIGREGNLLKRFRVSVSAKQFISERGISDADLPF